MWWTVLTALAADPEPAGVTVGGGVGAWTELAPEGTEADAAALVRVGYGLALPLWLELESGFGAPEGGASYAPRLQLGLVGPFRTIRPEVLAGLGVQGAASSDPRVAREPALVAHWGLSLGVPVTAPWIVRFDARHAIRPGVELEPLSHHLTFALGVEALLRRREPEPIAAAPPEPLPPPAPTDPGGPKVWITHPVCSWVPASDALTQIRARATGPVTVVAPGFLPQLVDPATAEAGLTLSPAPRRAGLVLVASPRDVVVLDGRAVALDPDGVTVLQVEEGPLRVNVVGGGRAVTEELAASAGFALWFQAPPPTPWEVRFLAGSAELDAGMRAELGTLAGRAGDWSFEVRGATSDEGTPEANARLARARAEAVQKALVEAGVPRERVVTGTVEDLDRPTPEEERVVLVRAVP